MINPQSIIGYLQENFGQVGRLTANNREFVMPSILVPNDYKKHFSINVDTGLWQDFKSGETGNFTKFLTIVEGITYTKAKEKVFLMEFLDDSETPKEDTPEEVEQSELTSLLPVNLLSCDSKNDLVREAWIILFERKLFNTEDFEENPFYVCTEGKCSGRLIIPYIYNNKLFYFQARALLGQTPKYLNPSGNWPKPSDLLYPHEEEGSLVICEGPLDAISLKLQGINATCTMGSSISDTQADFLNDFKGKIILGYDNDAAGQRGIKKFEKLRKEKIMPEFYVCTPPPNVKDWNDAHVKNYDLKTWVEDNTKLYDYDYVINSDLNSL